MRKLICLAALLLLAPAASQAETLEDLLVEKGVITQSELRGVSDGGPAKVYYQGGTRLEFPASGFTMKLNTQLQARYTFYDLDSDVGASNASSFAIRRARLIVSGSALHEEFSYKLQADFVGDRGIDGSATPSLKDAYIQWNACDWMELRMGQFKTAVSRQWNTGSESLQFPERTTVSDTFDLDRQVGLRARFMDESNSWSLLAGIYNGESASEGGIQGGVNRIGLDTRHAAEVALRATVMGEMDEFVEGDIDITEDFALNVGAAFIYSEAEDLLPVSDNTKINRLGLDATMKYLGWSMNIEWFWMQIKNSGADLNTKPTGGYAQTGYFFTPEFEVAARYGFIDCHRGAVTGFGCAAAPGIVDDVNEIGVSLNYYWWKHSLKAQLAWDFVDQNIKSAFEDYVGVKDVHTNRWMFQLSTYL